eukprot:6092831-Pleurochrysis_carterae.AAC.1
MHARANVRKYSRKDALAARQSLFLPTWTGQRCSFRSVHIRLFCASGWVCTFVCFAPCRAGNLAAEDPRAEAGWQPRNRARALERTAARMQKALTYKLLFCSSSESHARLKTPKASTLSAVTASKPRNVSSHLTRCLDASLLSFACCSR